MFVSLLKGNPWRSLETDPLREVLLGVCGISFPAAPSCCFGETVGLACVTSVTELEVALVPYSLKASQPRVHLRIQGKVCKTRYWLKQRNPSYHKRSIRRVCRVICVHVACFGFCFVYLEYCCVPPKCWTWLVAALPGFPVDWKFSSFLNMEKSGVCFHQYTLLQGCVMGTEFWHTPRTSGSKKRKNTALSGLN